MGLLEKYSTETNSNIDDQNSLHLTIKISMTDKECIKSEINDLLIFYSVNKDQLHLVRQAWIIWFHVTHLTKAFCYLYKQEIINNNNEILRWMEALKSNGEISILSVFLFFLLIKIWNEIVISI